MPKSVQEFLVSITEQAAKDLITAAQEVPAESLTWQPLDKGRTALDQLAECVILGGYTADVLKERNWAEGAFADYGERKAAMDKDLETLAAKLNEMVPALAAAIRDLTYEELDKEITTPFGPMTLEKIATYPYWNMSYHQGQITYIEIMAK